MAQWVRGYVLHARPFQDNKLLLDILTQEQGLIRGVFRRNKKEARVIPGPFLLFECYITGRSELKTVQKMEAEGTSTVFVGVTLYSAFYVHEILARLLPLNLPLLAIFDLYEWLLDSFKKGLPLAPLLRRFESGLFQELGMEIPMGQTSRGQALIPNELYQFHLQHGLRPDFGEQPKVKPLIYVQGAVALAYAAGQWSNPLVLAMAKELHRAWLDSAIGRPLKARQLLPQAPYTGERRWQVPLFREPQAGKVN